MWYGYSAIQIAQFQREQTAAMEAMLASTPVGDAALPPPAVSARSTRSRDAGAAPASVDAAAARAPADAAARAASASIPARRPSTPRGVKRPDTRMIGLLEVPRLRLATTVMSGDDAKTLKVSAGHLPDTPKPWERGNSAIAAHRDSHFRPLKNIRVGDEVRMRTLHGDIVYRVNNIKIVTPDDLSVLQPGRGDSLTLITCYPFNYIGSAPKRYIVQAQRIGDAATDAAH
jgi:sortase A